MFFGPHKDKQSHAKIIYTSLLQSLLVLSDSKVENQHLQSQGCFQASHVLLKRVKLTAFM